MAVCTLLFCSLIHLLLLASPFLTRPHLRAQRHRERTLSPSKASLGTEDLSASLTSYGLRPLRTAGSRVRQAEVALTPPTSGAPSGEEGEMELIFHSQNKDGWTGLELGCLF